METINYAELRKEFAKNNDTVDVSPLITSYASSEDGWAYLETLTTKELLSIKAQLYKDGIESDFVNSKASQGRVVYIVNKALQSALS